MADAHDDLVNVSDIRDLMLLLAATPVRLAVLSRDISEDGLQRSPSEKAWSVNEILAHLRACADVWGGSIQAMIERDHPTLRYVSPRAWSQKTTYAVQPFSESLSAFTAQRNDLLRAVRSLEPAAWARGATFTGTTRGREPTILGYVRRIVAHELEHVEQIEATLRET